MTEYVILKTEFGSDVRSLLLKMQDAILDPIGTGEVMLIGSSDREVLAHYLEKRVENPTRFPYCARVTTGDTEVVVCQEYADKEQLISSRAFVAWVLAHYDCEVRDNYGKDWTSRVKAEGVDVLYSGARLPPIEQIALEVAPMSETSET
jgi:hypothetical protein